MYFYFYHYSYFHLSATVMNVACHSDEGVPDVRDGPNARKRWQQFYRLSQSFNMQFTDPSFLRVTRKMLCFGNPTAKEEWWCRPALCVALPLLLGRAGRGVNPT